MIALKYWFEFTNLESDVFRCEILEKDFDGEAIEIHGNVKHTYAERKDLLQAVVASSLDIGLEADEDLTLQDLYSEGEQQFTVKLFRNSQIIFHGFLKPDGIWEDWVNDKWELSVDAMDGLSILKDLSFVKDDGTFYTGKITQFEAVKVCLRRIGYDLPINISTDLPVYDGFLSDDSILHNVKMNTERFYQDAQRNNIMDCERVLKDVLEPYNATVFQMNGEWWIFRPIDVKNEMNFYRYDGETKTDIVWNAGLNIGSHIDQYEIFHANANQKKSINPSTQAFRVNYKYGTVKELYKNSRLLLGSGLYAEGWYIDDLGGRVSPQSDGTGVQINNTYDDDAVAFIFNTDLIGVTENDIIDVIFNFTTSFSVTPGPHILGYSFQTSNFIMSEDGWISIIGNESSKLIRNYERKVNDVTETVTLPPAPEDGNLLITVWVMRVKVDFNAFKFYFNSIEVKPNSNSNYKGEFHTAQRSARISSVTKADKTVSVGDSESDIYLGTLYKLNDEPTTVWHRIGQTETLPLLRLMVRNYRLSPRPMLFFEGDVYGYFPYLTNILINNITGKFQPSKYNYDCQSNINRTNFKEYETQHLTSDKFWYEFEYDYGQETKVVINDRK